MEILGIMANLELLRVAGVVLIAVTAVVIGDTAGKVLTSNGVAPFLVAWSRFALAAVLVFPLSGLKVQELRYFLDRRVLLRSVLIACGICAILASLRTEPIANVFGAFFIGPIVSYVLAIIFLGEKPSLARTMLLGLGFLGVLLVVKPGFGMTGGMVFALIAGVFYGAYLAVTKTVATEFRPRFLLISQLCIGAILLMPFGLSAELPEIDANFSILITVSAIGSAAGNYLLVLANRMAAASLIAPLIYSQLVPATVLGVLVFDDWPDIYSLVGLVIIAISGLASLAFVRRETTSVLP